MYATKNAFSPRQIISHLITFPLKPKKFASRKRKKEKEFLRVIGDE
jgi:hypothetical protein